MVYCKHKPTEVSLHQHTQCQMKDETLTLTE